MEEEISAYLNAQTSPLNCASLCFSLAKLNYNQEEKMYSYLDAGKRYLSAVKEKNTEYWAFYRKVRFLELRLEFFNGADNEKIVALADEIIGQEPSFTVLNNHTVLQDFVYYPKRSDRGSGGVADGKSCLFQREYAYPGTFPTRITLCKKRRDQKCR